MSQAPPNRLNRQITHDGLCIAGKVRSVWLRKPLPESVRLRCQAAELTGLENDDEDMRILADCMTDGSLMIWYDQFKVRWQRTAGFLKEEMEKRRNAEVE